MEDHPELSPSQGKSAPPDTSSTTYAVQLKVDRAIQPALDNFDRQVQSQRSVVDRFRFFSPAILMQEALNDLSGVGLARHLHFMAQAYAFLDAWQRYFFQRIFRRSLLTAQDLTRIPRYVYSEESRGTVDARVGIDLAGILIPIGLLAIVAAFGIRRFFAVN